MMFTFILIFLLWFWLKTDVELKHCRKTNQPMQISKDDLDFIDPYFKNLCICSLRLSSSSFERYLLRVDSIRANQNAMITLDVFMCCICILGSACVSVYTQKQRSEGRCFCYCFGIRSFHFRLLFGLCFVLITYYVPKKIVNALWTYNSICFFKLVFPEEEDA